MLDKTYCYKILLEMKDTHNIIPYVNLLSKSNIVPKEVVQFINQHRDLELTNFYEKLRESYNNKKSKLYLQIVNEKRDPLNILKTISSFITRSLIFSEKLDEKDKLSFYKSVRMNECSLALSKYFIDNDISLVLEILNIVRDDIKILEDKEK